MFLRKKEERLIEKAEILQNLADVIRLDGCRSPYPPPAAVLTAVQDCATGALRQKQETFELAALRKEVAAVFGVSAEELCLCCCPAAACFEQGVAVVDRSTLLRPEQANPKRDTVAVYNLGRCFGLLGVNAWALIAPKELAERLAATCEGLHIHPPDRPATAALVAAMQNTEAIEKWRNMVEQTLRRAALLLKGNGFAVAAGQGPYLDITIPDSTAMRQALLECGIAVEAGKGHIRVFAGTEEEMERFYYALFHLKKPVS